MRYPNICAGRFISRPNRFIAHVEIEGQVHVCHVKNTGRCKELLVPGARVYLTKSDNPTRKTQYDLVAVEKDASGETLMINMDSQAPNRVFGEWAAEGNFQPDLTLLQGEKTYGSSRFDYYWESQTEKGFVEVKGVTLEQEGIVRFPDAPTQRGVKHLEELIRACQEGYRAAVCFVVQIEGMRWMEPNDTTHPEFGTALRRAAEEGVDVFAVSCRVEPDNLYILERLPVKL